jgi:AcrR family transcriptional regulator
VPVEVGARRNALKRQRQQRRVRGGGVSSRVQVSEMQRSRLLAAAVVSIAELGYARASVAHITARARVSRRTFYDLFASREDCLLAVVQDVVERVRSEIAVAAAAGDLVGSSWCDRVRDGLYVVLAFFDREPVLARVCVVDALQGGPRVLRWRGGILTELACVLDQGREDGPGSRDCTVLTAEGLVGAAFAIVYARLLAGEPREPLTGLLGELMSLIVLPYQGPAAARRERHRTPTSSPVRNSPAGLERSTRLAGLPLASVRDPLAGVPMRLTYRTARVLQAAAEHPGASNRHIGELADVHDQGQISKLLGRLQRLGLLVNASVPHTKGEPNAWRLTVLGEQVIEQLALNTNDVESKTD